MNWYGVWDGDRSLMCRNRSKIGQKFISVDHETTTTMVMDFLLCDLGFYGSLQKPIHGYKTYNIKGNIKHHLWIIYGFDGLTGTGGVDSDSDRDRQLLSSVSCRWWPSKLISGDSYSVGVTSIAGTWCIGDGVGLVTGCVHKITGGY